ncbi:MAG: hypothetical protein AAGI01_09785, partial [Myxococcota bacterium]
MSACAGCGSNNSAGGAAVAIDEDALSATFPGNDVPVQFTVTPSEDVTLDQLTWRVRDGAGGDDVTGEELPLAQPVTLTYSDPGTYTITVDALLDGEVAGTDTAQVTIKDPLTLAIDEVSAMGQVAINAGDSLNIGVDLENDSGADVVDPVRVGVYLSTSSEITSSDQLGGLVLLSTVEFSPEGGVAVAAGATRSQAFLLATPSTLLPDEYFIVAALDPE